MKVIAISILFFNYISLSAQIPIYLKEYNFYLLNYKCPDSFSVSIDSKKLAVINLYDCKGAMDIKIYKGKALIEYGEYSNSIDTLKHYEALISLGSSKRKRKLIVASYFQPIRNGTWIFNNENGKLRKKENYIEGILNN